QGWGGVSKQEDRGQEPGVGRKHRLSFRARGRILKRMRECVDARAKVGGNGERDALAAAGAQTAAAAERQIVRRPEVIMNRTRTSILAAAAALFCSAGICQESSKTETLEIT